MSTTIQNQTNSNNTVAQQHYELPAALQQQIQEIVASMVGDSLWCRIQCITVEEAANRLSVHHGTVRDWIHAGKLKASKVGREYMIRVVDIDKMLTANTNVVSMADKRFKRNRIAS